MDKITQLQEMIDRSKRIVFFGGAGVSTESNIPDFRSADGLYQEKYHYPPEQVVSHTFFVQKTEMFYDFYKSKMMFLDAKPNKAHLKLAELEKAGKLSAIITQNIDGLHQMAGSKLVVYPAAGFIDYFRGDKLVVLNKSATSRDAYADLCIQEPIGEVLESIKVEI